MQSQGTPTPDGIACGPNSSGKRYISLNAHRGSRPSKSKWRPEVTPPVEYEIFCDADRNEWNDNNGHYWGLLNRGDTILGMARERLSKFPCTSNADDPWHGYPVSPHEGDRNAPPDDLVLDWIEANVISKTFGRRILRRKI